MGDASLIVVFVTVAVVVVQNSTFRWKVHKWTKTLTRHFLRDRYSIDMTFDWNQSTSIELTLSADASLLLLPALAPPSPRLISSEYDDFNKRTEILDEDLIDEDFTSSCYEETFEFGAASNYSHFIFPSSSFGNYAPPPTSPVNLTDSVSAANTTSSSSSISSASSISHLPDVDEGSESAVAGPGGKRKRTTMPKGTKPGRERSNEV